MLRFLVLYWAYNLSDYVRMIPNKKPHIKGDMRFKVCCGLCSRSQKSINLRDGFFDCQFLWTNSRIEHDVKVPSFPETGDTIESLIAFGDDLFTFTSLSSRLINGFFFSFSDTTKTFIVSAIEFHPDRSLRHEEVCEARFHQNM